MSNNLRKMALAASLAFMHAGAPAEDIDLFVKGAVPAYQRPNVLIILDNTANWNTAFANEKSALVSTLSGLPVDRFNVGLMLFTESGGGNGNPDGAYMRAAVRTMDATNRPVYVNLVNSISNSNPLNDKGNNAAYGSAMAEAYRYFAGAEAYAGHNKVKRDYAANSVTGYPSSNAVYALPGNAFASAASTTYVSPVAGGCQKNFIIFISNGASDLGENSGAVNPTTLLAAAGGNTSQIALSPNGRQVVLSDEWARFLANNDVNASVTGKQTVVTYTMDVNPSSTGQGPDNTALLRSMAREGKGGYFGVSSANGGEQIAKALNAIFSEIQAVDSAFASASLPVSVNTQGTYLNQVFIGMFRPEPTPRWYGNLKQYQFRANVNGGTVVSLELADKNNNPAISSQNGFITSCAQSYWSTADTYWPNGYLGSCLSSSVQSNSPDGEIVEKGAAAQRLRARDASTRNVKTCNTCGAGALDNFNNANTAITKSLLGNASMSDADRTALINWTRGQNVDDELSKGTGSTVMRPSAHGDVVHARPLAIDYGGSTGVVVFYGGNDGMLRAINGNKPDSAGNELWSFVAPEHYGKLQRLKGNTPGISFPDAPAGTTPKDYFFDGSIGAYRSGSSTWIYPTMRRGGNYVYAFDVSTPSTPTLKWKRGPAELSNIGQTWSEPKVVKVANSPTTPVIIMGGGYDACEDQDAAPNTACTSPTGNRVFVLDADTGALLKTLNTDRSVPADITAVDTDGDGYVDMAYAVDTGANVYRIDIGTNAPGSWTISKIASLGCTGSAACARKFLHAPEVVTGVDFNAVLVGSGNRERPLLANAATNVDNAFFMIKDDRSASPTTITIGALDELNPETGAVASAATAPSKGWYLKFGSGTHDNEQVVTSSVVVAGVAYFSTHIPAAATDCGGSLGVARGYAVNYLDGSSLKGGKTYKTFTSEGLAPSPVAGVVSLNQTNADGSIVVDGSGNPIKVTVPFVIGGGGNEGITQADGSIQGGVSGGTSGIDPALKNVAVSGTRGRVYWYIQQ